MDFLPKKEIFLKDCKTYNLIPISSFVYLDEETPISIFKKLSANILLESVENNFSLGRYSIIGIGKKTKIIINKETITFFHYNEKEKLLNKKIITAKNPLVELKNFYQKIKSPQYEYLPAFFGGAIGYLGYETVSYYEAIQSNQDFLKIPDGILIIPKITIVYDNIKRGTWIITFIEANYQQNEKNYKITIKNLKKTIHTILKSKKKTRFSKQKKLKTSPIHYYFKKKYFLDSVKQCKKHIQKGDIIQVVLSQLFSIKTNKSPFEIYRQLRHLNPSPYLYFLDFEEFQIIGSSPEVMVKLENEELLLKPIAGTQKRGKTPKEDTRLEHKLLNDPKEKSEHLMLVDLGRNDLGRVSKAGSVRVIEYMTVEKYSHVMHLVSKIKSKKQTNADAFDVIAATFPAGTLSGAPKVRAMEIISELEPIKRSAYGGMILNIGFNGRLDSCITIRTIIMKNKVAHIHTGAGIVADSVPIKEYEETLNKAKVLFEALKKTT